MVLQQYIVWKEILKLFCDTHFNDTDPNLHRSVFKSPILRPLTVAPGASAPAPTIRLIGSSEFQTGGRNGHLSSELP